MSKNNEVHLRHLDKEVYREARRQQIAEGYRTVGEFLQHVLADYLKRVKSDGGMMSFELNTPVVLSSDTNLLIAVQNPGELPWYLAQLHVMEESYLTAVYARTNPLTPKGK